MNAMDIVREYIRLPSRKPSYDLVEEEEIIRNDTRIQVRDTLIPPYDSVVRLIIVLNGRVYRGTGFMVEPEIMLTAGHNIYDCEEKKYCDSIYAYSAECRWVRATKLLLAPKFEREHLKKYDWAAAVLPSRSKRGVPFINVMSMDSIEAPGVASKQGEIAGFPTVVRCINTGDMYTDRGGMISYDRKNRLLWHTVNTSGGNSGSPLICYKDGRPYAIGIHLGGINQCYAARAIDDEIIRTVHSMQNISAMRARP